MGIINRVIKKQPKFIKKIYYDLVPFKYRYGKTFLDTCDFLNEVDKWSYNRSVEHQFDQLKQILNHCNQNRLMI
jgi:hypothetical protein